ncbi:MAG: glycosyltransferase family A protein [Terriglobia bacterium]
MKASIIIPTFNRERYICQAVESALAQTATDMEIIVVDDGSTDSTAERIRPYLDRIRYIKTENAGPAHARNAGMRMSQGEYISFLDSDDLYYPYKTELQARFLDENPEVTLVYTEFSAFDDSGYWDEFHLKKYHKSCYIAAGVDYPDIFPSKIPVTQDGKNNFAYVGRIFEKYFEHILLFTNSMMFRRKVLEDVGFQNEKYWLFEELDFALRICKHYEVGFIDLPTYKLRYHRDQISSTSKEDGLDIVIRKQSNLLEIMENVGKEDEEFYARRKELVNRRLAVLHKSLAIPLMCKASGAKDARKHLQECVSYGYPLSPLWGVTFFPHLPRKIAIKLLSLLNCV